MQAQPKIKSITQSDSPFQSRSKLTIEPRTVKFDYTDVDRRFFFNNNAAISALWAGFSATFPLGEKEFINSVQLFKDKITDEKLKQEVKDFILQEAHHSVQHRKLNTYFEELGYDIEKVESFIGAKIQERVEHWSSEQRLARTVAAEHVTATMAHYALTHPHTLDDTPESFKNMLLWHSIEEIEHKSVAFDVYKHCVGDMKALRRHYLHFAFFEFPMNMRGITKFLLKGMDYKTSRQERKGMWSYLFGKDGMISSVKGLYWMFTKKGFHPWDHDDSELVAEWKEKLSPYMQTKEAA